jgi:hypothetical protein
LLCSKFTPLPIILEKVDSLQRLEDDPEELHTAIKKTTSKKDSNIFDAVGDRLSDTTLLEQERAVSKERGKVPSSSLQGLSSSQLSLPTKKFDHVSPVPYFPNLVSRTHHSPWETAQILNADVQNLASKTQPPC